MKNTQSEERQLSEESKELLQLVRERGVVAGTLVWMARHPDMTEEVMADVRKEIDSDETLTEEEKKELKERLEYVKLKMLQIGRELESGDE